MWGRWLLPENTFICLLQKCDFCLSCSFTFVFFWFFYHCTSRATCTSSVHHFRIGPKTSCPFICFVSFKKKARKLQWVIINFYYADIVFPFSQEAINAINVYSFLVQSYPDYPRTHKYLLSELNNTMAKDILIVWCSDPLLILHSILSGRT